LVGLTDQAEVGRLELAGAQPPEVDRKPARDRDDGFLSGRPGGERALGQDPAPFYDRFVGGLESGPGARRSRPV